VFNNAETVEESVKSLFMPEYEIVVVDSYSSDGTFEKLMKMRKDYNLRLFRLKCKRGAGRDLGLRKCSDGSMTAYADFDVVYNEVFHRLMEQEPGGMVTCSGQVTYFQKKEEAVARGGWSDLNASEDVEFLLRNGVRTALPAAIGRNQRTMERERRYARRGYQKYLRMVDKTVDRIRGDSLTINETSLRRVGLDSPRFRSSSLQAAFFCKGLYFAAKLKGMKRRYDPIRSNREALELLILERFADPAAFGVDDSHSVFFLNVKRGREAPDSKIKSTWNHGYKYECPEVSGGFIPVIYAKSPEAVQYVTLSGRGVGCDSPVLVGRFGSG
jgi:hypothetical protein